MSKIIDYRTKSKVKYPPFRCWRDVERVALRTGLTQGTLRMLTDRGFGSIKAVREITEDDLEVLPLYAGQQLAVSKLITHLNNVLAGFDIDDEITDTDIDEAVGQEEEKKPTKEELEDRERQDMIIAAFRSRKSNDDDEDQDSELGMNKLPRPHQFIVGKDSAKEITQEEFLYGNLLILEYFIEQKPAEVKASLKHIRFLILKLLHGYPLASVIEYDTALRRKMERHQSHMPKEADQDLIQKYLMLMSIKYDGKRAKKKGKGKGKKPKPKTKGKSKGKSG